jgi:hypothetical protein
MLDIRRPRALIRQIGQSRRQRRTRGSSFGESGRYSERCAGLLVDTQHGLLLELVLVVVANIIDESAALATERIEQDQQLRSFLDDCVGGILELTIAAQERQSTAVTTRRMSAFLLPDERPLPGTAVFLLGSEPDVQLRQQSAQERTCRVTMNWGEM